MPKWMTKTKTNLKKKTLKKNHLQKLWTINVFTYNGKNLTAQIKGKSYFPLVCRGLKENRIKQAGLMICYILISKATKRLKEGGKM